MRGLRDSAILPLPLCSTQFALDPPTSSLCLSLSRHVPDTQSFLGTDQVYDPVSFNQNKAGGGEAETKDTLCGFVEAGCFVYRHK